ncbi:methyltransferase domain-containing protein [candidate division GN15 bacterium]|nr:methyltransferase domain-containing protein [candidate division GN15 bacterium]
MVRPSENMAEYYGRRAPEYEQIYYRHNPQRRREVDDEADRLRGLVRGRRVLELACGTGYWTKVMSETAAAIVASDMSAEMIEMARAKEYGCPVEFVQADMYGHDFGTGRFDVVALGFWYSHHPRQSFDRLYEVLERPLMPGGTIWMVDNNPPAEGPSLESVGIDEHGNNYKKRYLDNGQEFTILKNYFERKDLEELLGRRFDVKLLLHNPYYWSAVLERKG